MVSEQIQDETVKCWCLVRFNVSDRARERGCGVSPQWLRHSLAQARATKRFVRSIRCAIYLLRRESDG